MNPADVPDLVTLFWCNLLTSSIIATILVAGVHAWRLERRGNERK